MQIPAIHHNQHWLMFHKLWHQWALSLIYKIWTHLSGYNRHDQEAEIVTCSLFHFLCRLSTCLMFTGLFAVVYSFNPGIHTAVSPLLTTPGRSGRNGEKIVDDNWMCNFLENWVVSILKYILGVVDEKLDGLVSNRRQLFIFTTDDSIQWRIYSETCL